MTLDELIAQLTARVPARDCVVGWVGRYDGSQLAAVFVGNKLYATWESELESTPVFDGKTPRGPKRYHSLKFYDGPAGDN